MEKANKFKPWEHTKHATQRTVIQTNKRLLVKYISDTYRTIFETVKDYNRSHWKLGDILKFGSGYYGQIEKHWEYWFLKKEEKEAWINKNFLRNKDIPLYARNQYAILLGRYRWKKFKGSGIYSDYGSYIMMLTGSKVGHIRKFYVKSPYKIVARFPYDLDEIDYTTLFHNVKIEEKVEDFLNNLTEKLTL